jgi:hypothetical protein
MIHMILTYLNWVVFSLTESWIKTTHCYNNKYKSDHLDRYEYNYQNYINAKFRITMNQTEDDYLIYDADDEDRMAKEQNEKLN